MTSRIFKLSFLLIFFLFPHLMNAEDAAAPAPEVKVEPIQNKEIFDTFYYPVSFEARQESEISSEIDGVVKEIKVKIGQSVASDQVLLTINHSKPDYSYVPFLVKSPIAGTVASINKKIGSYVKIGDSLIQIVNQSELAIRLEIPQTEISYFKPGLKGQIHISQEKQKLPVSVLGVSPLLNPTTGTSSAELTWDRSEMNKEAVQLMGRILPGMVGRASFKMNARMGILIPKDSVFMEKKSHLVRLVQDNKIVKRVVKIAKEFADKVEIREGLKEGDQLVVSRSKYLKEGEAVTIMKEAEQK